MNLEAQTEVARVPAPEQSPKKGAHRTAKLLAPEKASKARAGRKTREAARRPTTGQSGPSIESLPWDSLNRKERQVLECFSSKGERETRSIENLAEQAFPSRSAAKANSWVRNSLRRLVRSNWLEKVKPGEYRISEAGRKRMVRVRA